MKQSEEVSHEPFGCMEEENPKQRANPGGQVWLLLSREKGVDEVRETVKVHIIQGHIVFLEDPKFKLIVLVQLM